MFTQFWIKHLINIYNIHSYIQKEIIQSRVHGKLQKG